MDSAVMLLSGGLDSAVALELALREESPRKVHCFTIDYGQRNAIEIEYALGIAAGLSLGHTVLRVPTLGRTLCSPLTGHEGIVKGRSAEEAQRSASAYVPFRNAIFISLAAGLAESLTLLKVYTGIRQSVYNDTTDSFIYAMQQMIDRVKPLARITLCNPLMYISKKDTVRLAMQIGVNAAHTFTCYDPVNDGIEMCGRCDACVQRLSAFREAAYVDQGPYAAGTIVT